MVLVDANVLLDIFTADPVWLGWSRDALARALLTKDTVINPIIYSEVSMAFRRPEELDAELEAIDIRKAPLPYDAAFPAGQAFLAYRRRGGKFASLSAIRVSRPGTGVQATGLPGLRKTVFRSPPAGFRSHGKFREGLRLFPP